jgi:hypothetical protein
MEKCVAYSFSEISKELHAVNHFCSHQKGSNNFGVVAKGYQLTLKNALQKARRLFFKTFRKYFSGKDELFENYVTYKVPRMSTITIIMPANLCLYKKITPENLKVK